MTDAQIWIVGMIAVYLAAMLYLGFRFSKGNNSAGDFYLGGRQLGPFATAMSAEASDMSSWLLMGLPGVAYLTGLADAFWTAVGLTLGTYLNWLLVAGRLRHYSVVADNAITIPDFLSNRYHDKSGLIKVIAACVIIVFFVPYTASGFAACGKLFSSLFGADYTLSMLISALVIVVYTALGGFMAASTTDLIQSIVMTAALAVVLIFGSGVAGGASAVAANAASLPGYFSLTNVYNADAGAAAPYGVITIISTLAWGLGYFGMPHVLLRFMAIKDAKKLSLSRRVASVWAALSMVVAILIGMIGLTMSDTGEIPPLTGSGSESVIIKIADLLSQNGVIAALFAGIIISGILAATMSTADSQLLAAASSVSENLFGVFFKKKLAEKTTIWIARGTVVAIAVIAVLLARNPDSSVFKIVSFAWAGFGAAFGPTILLALFCRRSNKWGALCGMIAGGIAIFVWKFAIRPIGGGWNIYELLPAFLLSLAVNLIVSLLTEAPEAEILDEFDRAKTARDAA